MFYSPISVAATDTVAEGYSCGIDKNGDGDYDSEGEYSACVNRSTVVTAAPTSTCPAGYALDGGKCIKSQSQSVGYKCAEGFSLQGTICVKNNTKPADVNIVVACPSTFPFSAETTYSKSTDFVCAKDGKLGPVTTLGIVALYCGNTSTSTTRPNCDYMLNQLNIGGGIIYPTKTQTYSCQSGWSLSGQSCVAITRQNATAYCPSGWSMSGSVCTATFTDQPTLSCPTDFNLKNGVCSKGNVSLVCPLGDSPCVDINKNKPVDDGNIDGKTLVDDGKKNEDGVCLDQVFIFSGRASDCKLAGASTAFKNCCKSEGKVYTDGAGAATTILQGAKYVKEVYSAAAEAYEYYTVAMQATADAAVASSMAADAFVNAMMASFNPATIAVAVAIHFVMEYLMKACDQMSMETAMEAGSGMCHEVGTYCKKKVPLIGCIQKAKSYCCYNSILARIIQEQGRPQLTTFNGWGTPEAPQCRGFTPEEFQQLDFSKINLDEYVQTMVTAATSEIQDSVTTITQSFYDKTN